MNSNDQRSPETLYAPWLDRNEAQRTIDSRGLPKFRSEPWKYTNPQSLIDALRAGTIEATNTVSNTKSGIDLHHLSSPEAQTLADGRIGTVAGRDSTALMPALNLLNLASGYVICAQVPRSEQTPELRIGSGPNDCERFFVVVESGATLHIVETTAGGNRVFECIVEEGASLFHKRFQHPTTLVEYSHIAVEVGSNSSYSLHQYSTGATMRRNEISIDIVGERSEVFLGGGWRLKDRTHLDSQISVNHLQASSESQMKFHGVVGGRSKAIFNGRIYIARDAQHTSAHLNNKNILTSDRAEVYTKPELEIYADDVACSHGATSGQLDTNQLLYLRTRGISGQRARELLLKGFLNEVVTDDLGAQLFGIQSEFLQ